MPKNIWIINQYLTTPELNGNGYRHSYLADLFTDKGYKVTLITSSFSHVPAKDVAFKGLFKIFDGRYQTLVLKGNRFKNSKGLPRIWSWFIFYFLLFFIPKAKLAQPDIIIVSSMSIYPVLNVVHCFKRKFKKMKFVFEIRDIWPMSAVELGGYSEKHPFIRFTAWVEKLAYARADYIVSVLSHANEHIKEVLGNSNFKYSWISNGYYVDASAPKEQLPPETLAKIPTGKFIIGYAGTLGKANAIGHIITCMNEISEDIVLCILGDGNERRQLQKMTTNTNVIFLGKTLKSQVQDFLSRCNMLYLGLNKLHVFDYGISPQKLFDYMYAAKPILMSGDFKGSIVKAADCGFVVPAEDSAALRNKIQEVAQMPPKVLVQKGKNGKEYLLQNFTYDHLANRYIEEVFETL